MGIFGFFKKKETHLQKDTFNERRLIPRWKISALGQIKWEGQNTYIECELKDLNFKGFSIILTPTIPEKCTHFDLLVHERPFFFDVNILWHRQIGGKQVYGVKFQGLPESEKEKLYEMIHQYYAHLFQQYK